MHVAQTVGVDRGSGIVCARESAFPPPGLPYLIAGVDATLGFLQEQLLGKFAAKQNAQQCKNSMRGVLTTLTALVIVHAIEGSRTELMTPALL